MYPLSHTLHVVCLWVLFSTYTATATGICTTLASLLPNRVAFPGDGAYNASTASYAYANQQTQRPSCIVRPSSTADVSLVVKSLREAPQVPFAIRSGGHATNRGFSNIDGSVTVDLTSINAVRVREDGVTVSIGTGATWGDVYPVLDARKRSLNGGRASNVGVGGLLSGGGIGFFALQYGFACDAVVNMEVVLATGAVVNANEKSNRDLFIALKGGQNNFGIVTRFDITTIPQGQIWGGGVVYPDSTTAAQIDAFTHWKTPRNFDPASSVEQSHVYIGAQQLWLVSNLLAYAKPTPFPENLRNFTAIQPQMISSLRVTNVTDLANEIQSQSTPNQYTIFATTTIRNSPTILTKVHSLWKSSVGQMTRNNATITSSLTLQSIPAPPSNPSRTNILGFDPSSNPQKDLVLVLCSSFWDDPAVGGQVETAVQGFITGVENTAKQQGLLHRFRYPNYAAARFQEPLESTGNLDELRRVARKYDPAGMFQRQVIGGWKLY
ncbi:Bifunctional solanapyrone synthase [Madurella fahalii]|uniref:Bifunctional solanapyrone synthase n=1 Tax=Madurella fahalii TaxID=1157608 RepID=A0ABQ0GC01_9PEZI